jgi:oxalate---CoA ligase
MAYTALQLITRSRDKGIVIDDIAKTTGYSSGTAFYVVKVLQELNSVFVSFHLAESKTIYSLASTFIIISLKLRTAGQSMNIAIHRHFWERSPTWQRIHAEELEAAEAPDTEKKQSGSAENEMDLEEGAEEEPNKVKFDPIDSRYLSSAPLIRSRIIKLLKSTKNSIHAYPNLLLAIVRFSPFASSCRNTTMTV